ncbi:MAG: LysM peptidoglycan-binding domain-containing protein, partial [Candidatus Limnocylindrales bacterium]
GVPALGATPPLSGITARIAVLTAGPAADVAAIAGGIGERAFQAFELPAKGATWRPARDGYTADGTLLKPFAVADLGGGVDNQVRSYTVRSGDTLSKIAARFDLKMSSLFWANKLTNKDTLHLGQVLAIPPTDGVLYTVKEGDTIDTIAIAFYADVDRIEAYNGLTGDTVVIGETIMVPDGRGRPIPSAQLRQPVQPAAGLSSIPPWRRASSTSCTGWGSTSRAPTWIRVLRSYGPAAGKVQTVDFGAYVANVMAWEWPSYFPATALQAGAIAVKQYAWYYAMHWRGGETASGACYDVRDTTADQIYRPETRRASAAQRSAIATTWALTVRRTRDGVAGQFILTGYRSGTLPSCGAEQDGYHLFESGVQDCARQGKSLDEIERIYYGPTLQLVKSAS